MFHGTVSNPAFIHWQICGFLDICQNLQFHMIKFPVQNEGVSNGRHFNQVLHLSKFNFMPFPFISACNQTYVTSFWCKNCFNDHLTSNRTFFTSFDFKCFFNIGKKYWEYIFPSNISIQNRYIPSICFCLQCKK